MKKIVLLLAFCLSFVFGYGQYDLSKNIDRQIIVVPKKGMELQAKNHFNQGDTKVVVEFDQLGWYVILIPNGVNQDEFINRNKSLSFVQNLYKDEARQMQLDYIPNDVEFASCWHLRQSTDKDIDADEAWDLVPANNPTVSVAMFDGGLDLTIPDFVGNTTNPFNAVNSTTNIPYVNSFDKHGTTCSGTIAAVTNNTIGVSSVGNNKVKVMPVNIMSQVFDGGSFFTSDVIQINGVNAAMANPTCVAIAMSYGGSSYSSALDAAFQSARTTARGGKGMVVVASSGNGFSGTAAQYPANYSGVWGIGATTSTDVRAGFSNFGQICDISAPGASIRTIDRPGADGYNAGDYTSISGTSFSCPITAAAAAFVFYKNWELTDDQVLQILATTAEKVGGYTYTSNPTWPLSTRSNELGYGRINLKDAIIATPNPGGVVPPPPPLTHNFVVNSVSVTPNPVIAGAQLTINCVVATQNPTFSQVNVMTEYRSSTNSVFGDADDVILGTDESTLGNGVSTNAESITFNVANNTGLRYVFVRVNYMGSVSETISSDNTGQATYTINQPVSSGTDVSLILTVPSTSNITVPATQVSVLFQWKVVNTGNTPITTFTWRRGWTNCSGLTNPYMSPCQQTYTWNGNLQPGAFIYLPGGTTSVSWTSSTLCQTTTHCAIQSGGTNTIRLTILTVNGVNGDANLNNNQVDCTVNRLTTATNNGDVITPEVKFVEVRQFSNLYEKPIRYGSIDEVILEKGLNVIHIHYSDGTVEIKKISVN
jgi:hypothetical protein